MKLSKKILCCIMAAAMSATAFTACANNTATSGTSSAGTTSSTAGDQSSGDDQSSAGGTDSSTADSSGGSEESSGSSGTVEPPSNGSVLTWCGYYDINTQDKDIVEKFQDEGYTVEYVSTTSTEYFVKQAQLVASDSSPDMVSYEWMSFPHGIQQNLYTPLDDYIDLNSALWSGIKETADSYNYGGKHYYIPYQLRSGVVLIYNQTALDNEGISTNPFELYQKGEWTWDAWKNLMIEWCDLGEDYFGVMPTGFVAMPFIVSTGTPLIKVDGENKQILNNMKDANVQRCQDFLSEIAKENMVQPEYKQPGEALLDGKTLFSEFGLDWGYSTTKAAMKDQDIMYVPIPRDEQADKYYMNTDTFGYLVPANAKNVKATLRYMELCRENEIDPQRIENAKKEALAETVYYPKCTECGERNADKTLPTCANCGKELRQNTSHMPMSEELYDLSMELKNPESEQFTFLFDNCFGFRQELTDLIQTGNADGQEAILGGPFKFGDSYTTIRDKYFGTVEGYLDPYREALANS